MTTTSVPRRDGQAAEPRSVLLMAHPGREHVVAAVELARDQLQTAGVRLVTLDEDCAHLGIPVVDRVPGNVELVLTLGGDGTLLRGAEQAREADVPVLGVNMGRVGFLTETDGEHLPDALDAIIHRSYGLSERMTIDVHVQVPDGAPELAWTSNWALNEVSIEKITRERILDVVVEVDGRGVSAFGCDGLLCATPTGSTAYTFSAGGPIIWPRVEALLVVPSNAHALFARPLVVGADSVVSVHVDPEGHAAALTCDGKRTLEIAPGSSVFITSGERPVRLARLSDESFTERLVRKFSLPVHGWRDTRH